MGWACACAFSAAIKMADYALAYNDGTALALQRSIFRENRTNFLTFVVSRIVCETNKHWRSEMLSNRHTDTQTDRHTDPTTVPSLRMRAEGNESYCPRTLCVSGYNSEVKYYSYSLQQYCNSVRICTRDRVLTGPTVIRKWLE